MARKYKGPLKDVKEYLDSPEAVKIGDSKRLWILNIVYKNAPYPYSIDAKNRIAYHKRIKECTEDGKIALVFSGMDCDCVQYSDSVRIVESDWRKVDAYIDHEYEWADGPMGYYIEKPSIADELRYNSRDLALEAFEDGHPHIVYT